MYYIYLYSENDFKRSSNNYGYWTGKTYIVQGEEYPIIENEINKYKRKEYKSLKRTILSGEICCEKYGYVCGFDVEDENKNIVYKSYKNTSKPVKPYNKNDRVKEKIIQNVEGIMNKTNYENIIEANSIEELAKLLIIKVEEIPDEYCLGGSTIVYYTHSGERYKEDFEKALQEEIRWLQRDMELI